VPGEAVIWEYRVTNDGGVPLTGVFVMDDKEGLVCSIGDLADGQTEVCTLEGVAVSGPYSNLGTAQGTNPASPFPVQSSDPSNYLGEDSEVGTPTATNVHIMIKPGDEAPCMNPKSKGRTPVAILGTVEFDPINIDPHTVLAGEIVAPAKWGGGEDVNGDGLLDLVFHFKTQELRAAGLLVDGAELVVSGQTLDGGSFAGSDMVRLVKGLFCK
jgi:hypothetical protein